MLDRTDDKYPKLEGATLEAIKRLNCKLPNGLKFLTLDLSDESCIVIGPGFDMFKEEQIDPVTDDDIDFFGGENLIAKGLRTCLANGRDQANIDSVRIFSRKLLLALVAQGVIDAEKITFDQEHALLHLGELRLRYGFSGKKNPITGIFDLQLRGSKDLFQFCTPSR